MGLKVCYIWVEKFRNFENFGVNLSSSEKFIFDKENFNISKKKINAIPNKFFGSSVADVSGFIGKNGTGKSNLLELVCMLVKGGKSSIESDFLIITKDNSGYTCHYRFYGNKSFKSSFPIEFKSYTGDIENLKAIYFSNVYDERNHSFSRKVSDLSANNRYRRRVSSRKTSDFVKQFLFIRSEMFKESEIPTPTKVVLSPKFNVHNNSYWNRRFLPYPELNQRFTKEFKDFFTGLKSLKPSESKIYYFFIYVLISEILSILNHSFSDDSLFDSELKHTTNYLLNEIESIKHTYKSKQSIAKSWKEWCQTIINYIFKEYLKDTVKTDRRYKELEIVAKGVELTEKFQEFIKSKDLKTKTEGTGSRKAENYIFDFNNQSVKLDKDFYNFIDWSNKFRLDWLGLSSGQKAYLNIFSLLRSDLKNIKTDNVLICIDEGDLYLHPKWQADFFYKLVNLVPQFKTANYQFVLTSHSPFLVSDLPKENLVFLGEESINDSDRVIRNDKRKTFGGNLGELYIDAFFMEGSLISRFAANEIQKIVDKINDKEELNSDDKKVIELIGEDLIRVQIKNLLNDSNR